MQGLLRNWVSYIAVFCALCLGVCSAQARGDQTGNDALLGTWQGKLVINPSTQLTVQFIVTRDAKNKYAAVLNAPDGASLQNVAVDAVGLNDGKVTFAVGEVSGSYEGILKGKKIAGKWTQNGSAFDLTLAQTVKATIPAETMAQLAGPWNGVLTIPKSKQKLNLVISFREDSTSDSGIGATIDSPDQAVMGVPATSVSLQGGILRFGLMRPKMSFKGKLVGGQLLGSWSWTHDENIPFTLKKGKLQTAGLGVDKSLREKLNGNWYGKYSNGIGMALRFKDEKNGTLSAFLDSPYEGRHDVPITAVSLNAGKLTLRMDGVEASFSGVLKPNAIDGKFFAAGQGRSLTFARGEYVPEVVHIPTELSNKLIGKWSGKSANTTIVLRFQLNEQGNLIAVEDIPNLRLFSLPLSDFTLKGDDVSFVVKAIAAEFKGKVSKNKISGDWVMPSLQFPLIMNRADN
jgi:hypothetical protein